MNKPMIRHCYNCTHCKRFMLSAECKVRYTSIFNPRIRALTCRFYKQKEVEENEN